MHQKAPTQSVKSSNSFLTPECDNKSHAHDMVAFVPVAGPRGMRAHCRFCRRTYYLRLNKNGAPNKREYARLFYAMIVQPDKPLYYKVHPKKMKLCV